MSDITLKLIDNADEWLKTHQHLFYQKNNNQLGNNIRVKIFLELLFIENFPNLPRTFSSIHTINHSNLVF